MARQAPGDQGGQWSGIHQVNTGARQGITLNHIQPGKPQQNAYVESYSTTGRHEWLDFYIFETIEEAQKIATEWPWPYKSERPNFGTCGIAPARKLKMAARSRLLHPAKTGGLPNLVLAGGLLGSIVPEGIDAFLSCPPGFCHGSPGRVWRMCADHPGHPAMFLVKRII